MVKRKINSAGVDIFQLLCRPRLAQSNFYYLLAVTMAIEYQTLRQA